MRLKDLAGHDRPRERLLELGADALADRELLALLLGSGARDVDAIELAGRLITSRGSLRELSMASPHELLGMLGVGPAKAARVAAAFQLARRALAEEQPTRRRISATGDIAACAAPLLKGLRQERVVVIACNKAGGVLRTFRLTEGGTASSLIPVRDVLGSVLTLGAAAFAVAHNHPSGDPTPSAADRCATTRLCDAAETVGLRFLDHVVLTDSAWCRVTTDQ
jgi:DNA repair protein RadC